MSDQSGLASAPRGSPAHGGPSAVSRWLRSARRRVPLPSLIARAVFGTALLVFGVVLLWWWAIGGKWLNVETPSMGRAAPVGTLLWVRPTNIRDIHVGDIVTYRTPAVLNQPGVTSPPVRVKQVTFTHRVVGRWPDGTLKTEGDLNTSPDPWHTDQQHLVGRVSARWWGFGWLLKALPFLLLGGVAWWVVTGLLASKRSRAPLRVVGLAGLVAGALNLYNPLFGVQQIGFVPQKPHGATATFVGTGLMPWKLHAPGAHSVLVHSGEEASIFVPGYGPHGRFHVHVTSQIPWQTWPIVAAVCLIPAIWSVIVGVEPPPPRRRRRKQEPTPTPPTPQHPGVVATTDGSRSQPEPAATRD